MVFIFCDRDLCLLGIGVFSLGGFGKSGVNPGGFVSTMRCSWCVLFLIFYDFMKFDHFEPPLNFESGQND